MATTGIIQRRDTKANLITDPPITGELVFALDTGEHGWLDETSTLVWKKLNASTIPAGGVIHQALVKNSNADGDVTWGSSKTVLFSLATAGSGSGSGVGNTRPNFVIPNYDFTKRQRITLDYKEEQPFGSQPLQIRVDAILPSDADTWLDTDEAKYKCYFTDTGTDSSDSGVMHFIRTGVNLEMYVDGYLQAYTNNSAELIYELFDTQMLSSLTISNPNAA